MTCCALTPNRAHLPWLLAVCSVGYWLATGKYDPTGGAAQCNACPLGTTTALAGSVALIDCGQWLLRSGLRPA
jgi:hypothetical protein